METFHEEISSLKSAFESNGYPKNFIDSCIKCFLDKLFVKNKVSLTVPNLQLVCVLPYAGESSLDLRACLRRTVEETIPFCKLNIIFRFTCRLGNLFRFNKFPQKKKNPTCNSLPLYVSKLQGYLLQKNVLTFFLLECMSTLEF